MLSPSRLLDPERACWAEALRAYVQHGDDALAYVLEQTYVARAAGQPDKVDWWFRVSDRVVQLATPGTFH